MSRQLSLFDEVQAPTERGDFLGVAGLTYHPALLSRQEESDTLAEVDRLPWLDDLKRKVQHYGYRYSYRERKVDPSMFVGPLPEFSLPIARKLLAANLIAELPDQLIVNEYEPGQGINAHIDCEPCFKNTIVTVSLGWAYEMDFIRVSDGEVRSALLERGSALVMRDEGRYGWMHRIRGRLSDQGVQRQRRVSLTFRNVILSGASA